MKIDMNESAPVFETRGYDREKPSCWNIADATYV